MWRRRSSPASEVRSGSISARKRPKCARRVARLRHGRRGARCAALRSQIGGKGGAERALVADEPLVERVAALPVRRRVVEDAEMEEHPVRAVERTAVVASTLPGGSCSRASAGVGELVEIGERDVAEALAGLDEDPPDRL